VYKENKLKTNERIRIERVLPEKETEFFFGFNFRVCSLSREQEWQGMRFVLV